MSYLDHIHACNKHDLADFRPFRIDGLGVGWVPVAFAGLLAAFDDVFHVSDGAVDLAPDLKDIEARTTAVDRVLRRLAETGHFPAWRDEPYPVAPLAASPFAGAPILMRIERAAAPNFGVRAYGVHMTGFVRRRDGMFIWVARRAHDKPTYPGMLDNTVAGGQPVGIGLKENLIKECREEANIPPELATLAVPVGAISYVYAGDGGLKPDVQYCYDLALPEDFVPENQDGEICEFHLWPVEEVARLVRDTHEYKFNCNLVIIDFLIRHGYIAPDHPDYLALVQGLRQ